MEIIYAIYKENIIPLVGGVNPEGIEIGLADYNGWKLCAMAEEEFTKFSEFRLYPIPKSIAVGLAIIDRDDMGATIQEDPPNTGMPPEIKAKEQSPNDEQKELAELARTYMAKLDLKYITRAKIRQFKDFEDDLSDTKLLVEFLLGYIAEDFSTKTDAEKENYPIKDLMTSFVASLEGKDLRINNDKILGKVAQIIKDESFISRIVQSSYIDQLNKLG